MDKNGLKLIAIGIVLSHEQRKEKVAMLNATIESLLDSLHSSADVDGLPHGSGVSDPVSIRAEKIEDIEDQRNIEQHRINAVEWAFQYVRDMFREEDGDYLIKAILLNLNKQTKDALNLIGAKTKISQSAFYHAKNEMLNQVLKYLGL